MELGGGERLAEAGRARENGTIVTIAVNTRAVQFPLETSGSEAGFRKLLQAAAGATDDCEAAVDFHTLAQLALHSAPGSRAVSSAHQSAPARLLRCGKRLVSRHDLRLAATVLDLLESDYRSSAEAHSAVPLWVTTELAVVKNPGKLSSPSRVGSSSSGLVVLAIKNDSPYALDVLMAGPNARAITVPACGTCSDYRHVPTTYTCSGKPGRSMTVLPGTYTALVRSHEKNGVTPSRGLGRSKAEGATSTACMSSLRGSHKRSILR